MLLRVATTNQGKLREFTQVLTPLGYEVAGIDDLAGLSIEETGASFAANAIIKAVAVRDRTGAVSVGDDSGLEVDALDGAPGIYSARYASEMSGDRDAANRAKLVEAMRDLPDGKRQARFVCALALAPPSGEPVVFHGTLEGEITRDERGTNGFGYDPLFLVPSLGKTTAELSSDEKNRISHRGRALASLVQHLQHNPPR